MTSEEAKTKWCPMVRLTMTPCDGTWQNRLITNRVEFVEKGCSEANCIADGCALWRPDIKSNQNEGWCGLMHPHEVYATTRDWKDC